MYMYCSPTYRAVQKIDNDRFFLLSISIFVNHPI